MYDIHNLELDPITAGWKAHKAAQDRAQGRESAATNEGRETATAAQKTPENGPGTAEKGYYGFTLHIAHCRGNAKNVQYPSTLNIKGVDDLRLAAQYDHMTSKMVNNYRHTDNFMECDCIMFDVDNTFTEDPDQWKAADDIAEALPVDMYLVRSRNYMKPKSHTDKKTGYTITAEPREKWHGYLPLSCRITNKAELEKLINNILALFPFLDVAATDAARFFFGVEEPHVTYYEADCNGEVYFIDQYIEALDPEALRTAQRDALDDFTSHVLDGSYKNDRANQTTVKTICEFLNVANPLPAHMEPERVQAPAQGTNVANAADNLPDWMQYYEQEQTEQWFVEWAEKYNVELKDRYTGTRKDGTRIICYCVTCPWEDEHTPGEYPTNESVVIIEENGKLSYLCRHRHGKTLTWKSYRAYIEAHAKPAQAAPDQQQDVPEPEEEKADYLTAFFEKITGEQYKPYKTGISFFDSLLDGGPVKQTMLMLLAAPAAGKTTLCQQIAESMAEHGKPVLYVNLEMSREQMIAKSLSARVTLAGEPMTALDVLQGYKWYPAHRKAVEKALDQYREKVAPNLDYNPDGITGDLEKLAAYLDTIGERAKAAGKSGPVVFIDYLHLLTWPGEETANVIKKSMEILKNYSINYDTISVAISATNRDSNRAGRITMESGRDSSGIEYTGDYILSLNYYQVDQGDVKTTDNDKMSVLTGRPWRQMIIRVLKNRFGIAGRPTRVYFHAAGNRFYAEDDFLPEDQNIVMFGDPDAELDNAGMVFNINNLELPEAKTPRAGRKR